MKDVAAYQRMKAETGCDAVMVGRGAMGNPWFFQSLAALETGAVDPGPPTLAERRRVWRRHAALVVEHSPSKMRLHELRKTLAWYSRGLYGGSSLRQRGFSTNDPAALIEIGETFFADLEAAEAAGTLRVAVAPADPVKKSMARHNRRGGSHAEAEETARGMNRPRGRGAADGGAGGARVRGRLARRHRRRDQHPGPPQRPAGAARDGPAGRLQAGRDSPDRDGAAHGGARRAGCTSSPRWRGSETREAVPILRHAALFDVAPEVRSAGESVLSRWAADPSDSGRAARAGTALAEVARRRAAGEGPLLYGDGGLPGVPSTVGAPDLLGASPAGR